MVFITSFTVLFPLFAKIGIGFALRHIGILTERSLRELNNMVFRVLLPVLLFSNLYKTDFATIESYNLLWFAVVIILITFTGYMMIIPKLISDNAKRGVLVQGITRSNFIFFGMPLATSLYGGTSVGIASLMVGVVVPLLNMTSVVSLEYFRGHRPDYQKILRGIITNPIIIGGALGLACTVTHIRLPEVLERLVFEIAGIATPVALIVLGGSVTFASVRMNRKPLIIGVINRLIVLPAIGTTISVLAGFRDLELLLLLCLFAAPSAVSSFAMAQQMEGDADLAGQMVVLTTVFSLITLFFWLSGFMLFTNF